MPLDLQKDISLRLYSNIADKLASKAIKLSAVNNLPPGKALSISALEDLKNVLPVGARLLGIDPGTKTLGMAISDRDLSVASPIGTIQRTKFKNDAQKLRKICRERGVGGIIMGLPVNMDGTEGPRCQSVRQLAENIATLCWYEGAVCLWDERLSTLAVERFLVREADMTRKRRSKIVDKAAAAYILQGALDAMRHL